MEKSGLSALVYGATGAIGAELVALLLGSPKWSKVHLVVRKQLQEWKTLKGNEKLVIEKHNDLDDYFKQENTKYKGVDSLFCCFGSQVKHGDETFIKIDKTYPLLAADIALKNNINHYLLVSSKGGDVDSWFLYLRTKGQVERDLALKKLNLLSIFKPGLLRNRRDARFGEKVASIFPFVPGIQAVDFAKTLVYQAQISVEQAAKSKESVKVFQNCDLCDLTKQIK